MEHHFTVPVPVDVAWSALLDPERVAPCMPGATLTSVEGSDFAGSVKVRMGPVSLMYKGSGTFSEIETERHRVVIDASGKDSRGNGTASATVTALLAPDGDDGGSTQVRVDTDLKVTGKPAQLGRGLISEVAGKLLNQFADCLAERLQAREPAAAPAAPATGEEQATPPDAEREPSYTGAEPAVAGTESPATAGQGSEPSPVTQTTTSWRVTEAEAGGTAGTHPTPDTSSAGQPPGPSPAGERAVERSSEKADAVVKGEPVSPGDAIDLLEAAGAPVLKRVVPVVVGVVAVVVAVVLARRRRSRRR